MGPMLMTLGWQLKARLPASLPSQSEPQRLYHLCGSATSDSSYTGSSNLAMLTHHPHIPAGFVSIRRWALPAGKRDIFLLS